MFLRSLNAEVRLFLIAYTEVGLEGNNDGLINKSIPLWALLRIGELKRQNDEYLLGIRHQSGLQPLFFERKQSLLSSPTDDARELLKARTALLPSVKKSFSRCYGHSFLVKKGNGLRPQDQVLRIAALIHLNEARRIILPIEEGLGLFLTLDEVGRIKKKIDTRQEQGPVRRKINMGNKSFTGILSLGSGGVSIDRTRLVADLDGEAEDISFVHEALTAFTKRSTQERALAWKRTMSRRF